VTNWQTDFLLWTTIEWNIRGMECVLVTRLAEWNGSR